MVVLLYNGAMEGPDLVRWPWLQIEPLCFDKNNKIAPKKQSRISKFVKTSGEQVKYLIEFEYFSVFAKKWGKVENGILLPKLF